MALQQHHLLSDVTIRGFVAGATNILFRQQKHLSDAIVEVCILSFIISYSNYLMEQKTTYVLQGSN